MLSFEKYNNISERKNRKQMNKMFITNRKILNDNCTLQSVNLVDSFRTTMINENNYQLKERNLCRNKKS